ncbi:hypothetical protein DEJ51_26655 [Streptomyces venezuelae]|uniref:Uncharacterized protein n=1 Tax=Streptomyces venezuelae TaxID=54571 RepID=A0A5P2DXE0_STRVZ|nr:hypothetical protein [Streptomyces venezuelae]QES57319.1 hypothetical protein DEJ51_26655 [Streptomyces venezuelae]
MHAAEEHRQELDSVSILNAKRTLLQLLGRAGVRADDAEGLIALVEAGALAEACEELGTLGESVPGDKGEPYESGWLDGAKAVTDELGGIAARALRHTVDPGGTTAAADPRPPVRRMEVERAKVAVTPLYLAFTDASDLDPEVTEEVLSAVLGTMTPWQRAGYAARLAGFATEHRARLERLYAQYGPGSATAIHGRYSLLHSATSVAVLERLATSAAALREEWDSAELPPAWLDGPTAAWDAAG